MDILLCISRLDAGCKLFDKDLLAYTLGRLEPSFKVKIFTMDEVIRKKASDKLVKATNLVEALDDFGKDKDNFIVITRLALCNVNFENLIKYHSNHDKKMTIVCKNFVKNKSIPIYKLNEQKEITAVTSRRFADAGIYLFKGKSDFKNYKNIKAIILDMIDKREVKAYVHKGYFWTSKNIKRRADVKGTSN
jgi:NDP-sugar pyrophosphorylase family protein